eukprot:8938619-Lingulodinium_polyedra.AAC.1
MRLGAGRPPALHRSHSATNAKQSSTPGLAGPAPWNGMPAAMAETTSFKPSGAVRPVERPNNL